MNMSPCTVCWKRHGSTLDLRIDGRGTMPESLAIRRSVENQPTPAIKSLRVHLAGCTFMDSTFIGTLIFLKRSLAKSQGSFVLVCPSSECRQLLTKMGIARVFCVEDKPSDDDARNCDWQELSAEPVSPCSLDFKENVCEAHQRLAEEEGSRERFESLAAMLQRELAKERQALGEKLS